MHQLSTEHVTCALPGDRISTRRLEFPFRDRKRLGQAVPFEIEAEIPFESRIIAVCDAFESMTSASGYGDARSIEDALAELGQCKGTQFDPEVVVAFHGLAEAGHLDL